ncbi:MAG: hypothetical protein H0W17_07545 [Chloroflexi bacterium]|nr:hypothetical protein [Chloroflexota bacterium]
MNSLSGKVVNGGSLDSEKSSVRAVAAQDALVLHVKEPSPVGRLDRDRPPRLVVEIDLETRIAIGRIDLDAQLRSLELHAGPA